MSLKPPVLTPEIPSTPPTFDDFIKDLKVNAAPDAAGVMESMQAEIQAEKGAKLRERLKLVWGHIQFNHKLYVEKRNEAKRFKKRMLAFRDIGERLASGDEKLWKNYNIEINNLHVINQAPSASPPRPAVPSLKGY
jgi:hypothetical protein